MDILGSDIDSYDCLILANNSVIGPMFPLNSLQEALKPTENVVIGMTESNEREHHLQSYFLMIPRAVFMGQPFRCFWQNMRFLDVKKNIVYAYEMGLSRALKKAGTEIRALYPTTLVGSENPTHKIWMELLRERKCPYLKRDILRQASPQKLNELRQWVSNNSFFDPQWI
ncbi:MAG: hypothetical protein HC883_04080 [Bdellovibrionaceae bacterium]|nr:hypothetical protein [Pseudobdellovibrionaceae bacterium]